MRIGVVERAAFYVPRRVVGEERSDRRSSDDLDVQREHRDADDGDHRKQDQLEAEAPAAAPNGLLQAAVHARQMLGGHPSTFDASFDR